MFPEKLKFINYTLLTLPQRSVQDYKSYSVIKFDKYQLQKYFLFTNKTVMTEINKISCKLILIL